MGTIPVIEVVFGIQVNVEVVFGVGVGVEVGVEVVFGLVVEDVFEVGFGIGGLPDRE
jgi:hypothetical protein